MRFLDIETTGLNPWADDAAILMVGWADDDDKPTILHLADTHPDDWVDRLRTHLSDSPPIVGHNVKFDLKYLRRFGVKLEAESDTMLISQLADENRVLKLKTLMADEMGGDWTWQGAWDNSDPAGMARYLAMDVVATRKLYHREYPRLTMKQRALLTHVVIPALNALVVPELNGVYMSREKIERTKEGVLLAKEAVLRQLDDLIPPEDEWPAGVTPAWGATNWQRWFLFTYLGIKAPRKGKPSKMFPDGAPSMSADVLAELHHPAAALVRRMAKLNKVQSGFLTPYATQLDNRSRLYTSFYLDGTVTGRLAAGKEKRDERKVKIGFNIQQVPKDDIVKPLFEAPPGYVFMEADQSQLELRVAAVIAGETTMLRLYNEGADIHTWMARQLLHKSEGITELERRTAKATNFGFLYGMRPRHFVTLARTQYGLDMSEAKATTFREHYFKTFPGLARWHEREIAGCRRRGYVSTLSGRRRHLPDINAPDFKTRSAAERQAINSPVQGTGSDIVLAAFARLGSRGDGWLCIGLVHDALLFYVKESIAEEFAHRVKAEMERPLKGFSCPLIANVTWGKHWGDHTHEL